VLERTRFGATVRAAVDNPRVAEALGIFAWGLVFQIRLRPGAAWPVWAVRSAWKCLGWIPAFPSLHGVLSSLLWSAERAPEGPLYAALLLGVADVAGKYYIPQVGAFIIYAVMVILLVLRPQA
jgi:branched-chain amino acid transport system permease protein